MISSAIKNTTGTVDGQRLVSLQDSHEDKITIYDDLRELLRNENYTMEMLQEDIMNESKRDPLYIVIPITIIYVIIFFTGVIGNVSTCVVIARNKSMHTATNYYLFSLAISDLLLLLSGLPPELYFIWSHFPYVFGEAFCVITSFAAETSANATVLTITAFTVERYVAICHPFVSHTMSKLSRAVKFIVAIWLLALCLAVPQAIQYGVTYQFQTNGTADPNSARCSIKWKFTEHVFEISTMLFFVFPMTVITVLYVLIAVKLRRSRLLTASAKSGNVTGNLSHCDSGRGRSVAQRNVIRMLVAVVVAFFICWAPFHAQRLLAIYAHNSVSKHYTLTIVYVVLTYVSGVLYYLSTTVNPLLYNIMSNKFREAFKSMLSKHCGRKWSSHHLSPNRPTYSSLSRYRQSTGNRRRDRQPSGSLSISDESQKLANGQQQQHRQRPSAAHELNETFCKNSNKEEKGKNFFFAKKHCREFENGTNGSPNSSEITLMTSVGKGLNEGNNNLMQLQPTCASDCFLKIQGTQTALNLGLWADRLRFGTRGFFAPQRRATMPTKVIAKVASAVPPRLQSHTSIDSANTISNSSLQDLDETEFTGSELAQYMGELNLDLVT